MLPDRLARLTGGRLWALCFLLGGLSAGGQAPVSLPWLSLAGLALVAAMVLSVGTPREAFGRGWWFGTGYFAAALFWIVEPFFVDAARHAWMAPFALGGLSGGLALIWGGAFWAAVRWSAPGWPRALAWAGWLTAAELARSYMLTGFPWALIGHVWVGWPPMSLAAWVGPLGLTLATLAIAAVLGMALWRRSWGRAIGAVVLGSVIYGGTWLTGTTQQAPVAETQPVLRLVQPNAPQHLKWHPDHAGSFFDRQVAYTAAEPRPDLIIWPETSVPAMLHNAEPALDLMAGAAQGVPVVFGIQRWKGEAIHNSLVVLDAEAEAVQIYDKHHLVPFGEYMPLSGLMTRMGIFGLASNDGIGFSPGPGPVLLDLGAGLGTVLPLICYEAIFPQDLAAAPGRPDWLLQITNDAWFGQISGPYQHLAQARLRAVEQGLPMVRVANTGVSAVIDAHGHVVQRIGLGEAGYLDIRLPPPAGPTLYARTGDIPVAIAIFTLVLLSFSRRRRMAIDAAGPDN